MGMKGKRRNPPRRPEHGIHTRKHDLTNLAQAVKVFVEKTYPALPRYHFRLGCRMISEDRKSNPRAFCHVDHFKHTICVDPSVGDLKTTQILGLFLHEYGHPIAIREWGERDQLHADRAVKEFLGIPLKYTGDLLIQDAGRIGLRKVLALP